MRFNLLGLCFALVLPGASVLMAQGDGASSGSGAVRQSDGPAAISQLDYILQPYDVIHIVVFQEPDLEREVRLSDDCSVSLPLVGVVALKDNTIGQAQKVIRDLYDRDYLVNPQISLTVVEYAKETVNVLGSVNAPGAIMLPPDEPLNLVDAITRAGGFSRLADRKKVKLTQIGLDGKTTTSIINVDDIIQSHSSDQIRMHKGDVVYVPERIL